MAYGASDASRLINIPAPIRWIAIGVLLLCLLVSLAVSLSFIGQDDKSDWILLAMSVVQIASSGLVAALIIFYSEREAGFDALQRKTKLFLAEQLPSVLGEIREEGKDGGRVEVTLLELRDIFGALYEVRSAGVSWKLWLGLNVDRLICIYFVSAGPQDVPRLRETFAYTFGGAEKVGYSWFVEPAIRDGEQVVSMWLAASDANGILNHPDKRLFWAQDVAIMTQSFLRTAHRAGVQPPKSAVPGPL